jgi:hypothetical protein
VAGLDFEAAGLPAEEPAGLQVADAKLSVGGAVDLRDLGG